MFNFIIKNIKLNKMNPIYIVLLTCIVIFTILFIIYFIYSKKILFNMAINVESNYKTKEMNEYDQNLKFCFDSLKEVSRSFNIVIQQLDNELKNVICIFYLVLRGLDTIEDDMSIPIDKKKQMLLSFYNDIENENFTLDCGDKPEYKNLMNNFNKVIKAYKQCKPKYREVIKEITNKMAHGMIEFLEKDKLQNLEEYNLYCHYVAGLVGIGLSQLFTLSGTEMNDLSKYVELSNSMGCFLQKTNIIRDVKEDIDQHREWWPSDFVSTYVSSNKELLNPNNQTKALECMNAFIINAMNHIPQCIEYLSLVSDNKHFRFCAIPQVVAIQTLAFLFNNSNVFKKTEKLNKTILARIFMDVHDLNSALEFYIDALEKIENKINTQEIKNVNVHDLEKVKGYIVKYIIENSNHKKEKIDIKVIKKSVISNFILFLKDVIIRPLSNI